MLGRVSDAIEMAKHIWEEVFRERELILRSQGRVHFIPLTRRLQMCAVSIILAVGFWGIGVTLMSTVKSGVIQVKNDEIREARVAYEDLFDEVLRYQKKVATVTTNLRESQESLLAKIGDVPGVKDKVQSGSSKSKAADSSEKKANLREHLNEIDRKVRNMTETNGLLEGSLSKIKTELKLAGDERDQIIKTRTKLRERVSQLEEMLVQSRTDSAYMERRLAEATTTLSQSKSEQERVGGGSI